MSTRRLASATPAGPRNSNALATVKMAVFAPMPIASESRAVAVTIGLRRSIRTA
jgi:hypothetical protein